MISYNDFKSSLREISKDTSHVDEITGEECVMTSSMKEAVDFDEFSERYFKDIHPSAKKPDSLDALCMLNKKYCFIEFKNGNFKRNDVVNKIGNSVSTILFKDNIEPECFKNNSMFILVYNKENKKIKKDSYKQFAEDRYLLANQVVHSEGLDEIRNHFANKAEEPIVLFNMNDFQNIYFEKVLTMDKDIFDKYIEENDVAIPDDSN